MSFRAITYIFFRVDMFKPVDRIRNWLGLSLAAAVAVIQKWSLQEFCWSIWVAGLFLCWFMVVAAGARVILSNHTLNS